MMVSRKPLQDKGYQAAGSPSALCNIDPNSPKVRDRTLQNLQYKTMVGELQEMVEELEGENKQLTDALINEQQNSLEYKQEYDRIRHEGSQLFERYEQKTRRLKQLQQECSQHEQHLATMIQDAEKKQVFEKAGSILCFSVQTADWCKPWRRSATERSCCGISRTE
jgi:predicted RNase H-like nuclease (RuvC/YqgF family)